MTCAVPTTRATPRTAEVPTVLTKAFFQELYRTTCIVITTVLQFAWVALMFLLLFTSASRHHRTLYLINAVLACAAVLLGFLRVCLTRLVWRLRGCH